MYSQCRKRSFRKMGKCILWFLLVFILYMGTIQPLIACLFIPPIEYHGKEIYLEEDYLMYRKAEIFRAALDTLPFLKGSEIEDFYYFDSILRDNLFTGEYGDVYILDLNPGNTLEYARAFASENGVKGDYLGVFDLYWLPNVLDDNSDSFYLAISEEKQTVRCILYTCFEGNNYHARRIGFSLYNYFPIEWE